jgi:TPR repeat protein
LLENAVTSEEADARTDLAEVLLFPNWNGPARERATKLLREATVRGSARAASTLCRVFIDEPSPLPQRIAVAMLLAASAVDRGEKDAWGSLGLAHEKHDSTAPGIERARECYTKGAALGSIYCEFLLGNSLANAPEPLRDPAAAFEHFVKAADHRYPAGMREAGRCLLYGRGVAADEAKGVDWLRKAVALDDSTAQLLLGSHLLRHGATSADGDDGVRLLEAASAAVPLAIIELASAYEKGCGVKQNVEEAVRWWRKGAEQGDARCLYEMGRASELGLGVARDEDQAWIYLNKAADLKYPAAFTRIGTWHLQGKRGKASPVDAVAWFQKAADLGNPTGMNNLGYCYQTGNGVAADPERAVKLYLLASALGEQKAYENLAICYTRGIGVPVNPGMATYYRNLAIALAAKPQHQSEAH